MGRWVKWMMGFKEGTCDAHWVLCGNAESLNCTPKSNVTLYVNSLEVKNLKKKEKKISNTLHILPEQIYKQGSVLCVPGTLG